MICYMINIWGIIVFVETIIFFNNAPSWELSQDATIAVSVMKIIIKVAIAKVSSKFNSGVWASIVTLECIIVQLFIKDKTIESSMRDSSMRHYKSWELFRNILFFGIYCFLVLLSLILLEFIVG